MRRSLIDAGQGFARDSCCRSRVRRIVAGAVLLLAVTIAGADDELALLADHYTGVFSSEAQAARDDRYLVVDYRTVEIWPGRDGRWFYTEQHVQGQDAPYRQRIQRLFRDDDDRLRLRVYTIPEPGRLVGAWQAPERLRSLSVEDLRAEPDCDNFYAQTEDGVFEGGTRERSCPNAWRGASWMRSISRIDAEGFENWDRGFDDDGEHIWGPADGGYRFVKLEDR